MADESKSDILWENVQETPTTCTIPDFFDSLQVWIDKPHVVNRRLSGSLVVKHAFLPNENVDKIYKMLQHQNSISASCSVVEELAVPASIREEEHKGGLAEVLLRRVLPRQMGKYRTLIELVIKGNS